MHASMRMSILLSVVALVAATPYYLPQQRQLFYPVVPQYHQQQYSNQYSAPLAPFPYRQFIYPQQTASNLVVPMPALRYPSPVVAPAKQQVVYYPGALPYPYVLAGDDTGSGFSSWISTISNYFTGGQEANEGASVESGNTGAAPVPAPASPESEQVEQAESSEQSSKGGDKDKMDEKPVDMSKLKGVPQQFAMSGQPQYFGNFGLQRFVNPAMVLPTAHNGAVSSYLFLKNIPGVRFASPVPQIPQAADAVVQSPTNAQPGEAALDYQKYLLDAQADRMQKDFDDSSVIVDAAEAVQKDATAEEKPASESEAESDKDSEDEETGTANNE